MSNLPFDFTEADRSELVDELTKLISQIPRLIGTEVNWIEQAAQSILRGFEEQTVTGIDGLTLQEIDEKIRIFVNDESNIFAPMKAAEKVLAKLKDYFEERSQPVWAEGPSIPTDETHDFALGFREMYEQMNQALPASEILTEAEALAAMVRYKEANGVQRLILLARPKPASWTVLDYQG